MLRSRSCLQGKWRLGARNLRQRPRHAPTVAVSTNGCRAKSTSPGLAAPEVGKTMSFSEWFDANKDSLKPPVANKLMYENALKVMIVGGPNQRTDYHLQRGEELFWQLKGTAIVNIVQEGNVQRPVHVPEGHIWLLPASVPHNPTREAGSVGFVFERERFLSELDAVQWYTDSASADASGQLQPQYRQWFHCYDLGTQLGPVIKEHEAYLQSEAAKCSESSHSVDVRPTPEDPIAVPHEPFHLESWIADQSSGSHLLFDSEFVMHVHKGPCEMPAKVSSSSAVPTEHGVGAVGAEESFVYQLNGTGELVQAEGSPGAATLPLHSGDMTLIEQPLGASLRVEAGGTAISVSNRVARRLSKQDLAISTGGGLRSTLEINGPALGRRSFSTQARAASPTVVDMHSHFLPREWPNFAEKFGGEDWPWMRHTDLPPPSEKFGYDHHASAMLMKGDKDFRPINKACWDAKTRLKDLDAAGIHHQIVCATPILFQWDRDPVHAAAVSQHMNDYIVEACHDRSTSQGRLHALCQVPLQDIDLSCREVERVCCNDGPSAVGVQIGNHVGNKDLDDEGLITFLQHCAEKDVPVLVHPWDMNMLDGRLEKYMMGWTVGMPLETHLSIVSMILGGSFDRLPKSLRLCFAHGGGAFPYLLGRLDNAWRERSIARGKSEQLPSSYCDRFSVDSAVFDPKALELLTGVFGAERIMLGSDYPFPLGEQKIGDLVKNNTSDFLNDEQRSRMLGQNAIDFFKLDVSATTGHDATPISTSSPLSVGQVGNFINGAEVAATGGATLPLENPASGLLDGELAASNHNDVDQAVSVAQASLEGEWRAMSLETRCSILSKAADLMEGPLFEDFVVAESSDTGKPLALARNLDIPRAIANLRFFAHLAQHANADELRHIDGPPDFLESLSYTVRKPIGVVGLVTPWNLPLYLLSWKLAPALAMGNTIVAKPSEITPRSALLLAKALQEAGLPDGVFNIVQGYGAACGSSLVSHPDVSAVSFTGGTATGAQVAALAAPQFKKLSLELGGKNPCVVFADCDIEATVRGIVRSSFLNSGQICLCGSRILVEDDGEGFYDRFLSAFAAATESLIVGDPAHPDTNMGPLSSEAHRNKISSYVALARENGGEVVTGGAPPSSDDLQKLHVEGGIDTTGGYFWRPTIIAGLSHDDRVVQEEIFGPVVTVHKFQDESEAIALANDTKYGLAAQVWTTSMSKGHNVAAQIDAGTIWVNCWLVRQLHMPFGGYKASGVAREGGTHSLNFYSETSTVCVKTGALTSPPLPGRPANVPAIGKRSFSTRASRNDAFDVEAAPRPVGAYVHAKQVGETLYLAGIGPRHPETNEVPGGPVVCAETNQPREYDAAAQTRQVFDNIRAVLDAAGSSLEHVVDVQCFLTNMERDFPAFNKVYAEEMKGIDATRTTIGITALPPNGKNIAVEFKVIATLPSVDERN